MLAEVKKCDLTKEYYFDEGCFITELSNSISDEQLSIARARVEPGKTTKWHYLKNTTERYVILEGEGIVEIGELAERVVTAGDVVIIPSETRQRISNSGKDDLIFLALCTPCFTTDAYVSME